MLPKDHLASETILLLAPHSLEVYDRDGNSLDWQWLQLHRHGKAVEHLFFVSFCREVRPTFHPLTEKVGGSNLPLAIYDPTPLQVQGASLVPRAVDALFSELRYRGFKKKHTEHKSEIEYIWTIILYLSLTFFHFFKLLD
jgi:hypothetical protein